MYINICVVFLGLPHIMPEKSSSQAVKGENITITLTVFSNSIPTIIKWTFGHTGLTLVNNSKYNLVTDLPNVSLTITDVVEEDSASYFLTASNNIGTTMAVVHVTIQGG